MRGDLHSTKKTENKENIFIKCYSTYTKRISASETAIEFAFLSF